MNDTVGALYICCVILSIIFTFSLFLAGSALQDDDRARAGKKLKNAAYCLFAIWILIGLMFTYMSQGLDF